MLYLEESYQQQQVARKEQMKVFEQQYGITRTSRPADSKLADSQLTESQLTDSQPVDSQLEMRNAHTLFILWFWWGLTNYIVSCVVPLLFFVASRRYEVVAKCGMAMGMICCFFVVSFLAWIMCGCVWRFSKMGKAATMDLVIIPDSYTVEQVDELIDKLRLENGTQVEGGFFIKWFSLCVITAISMSCIVLVVVSTFQWCRRKETPD